MAIEVRNLSLADLVPSPDNVHHMDAHMFGQLVKNLRRDQVLSSAPLVVIAGEGKYRIISGHHRVEAAKTAGIKTAHCLVITEDLTQERLLAIQLSHNAIVGEDDMVRLQKLWTALPLSEQLYSGLTDDSFKLLDQIPSLANFAPHGKTSIDLTFTFTQADADVVLAALKRLGNRKGIVNVFADMGAYDVFFAALVETKMRANLISSAIALRRMAHLAMERFEQLEAEAEAEAAAAATTPEAPAEGQAQQTG